MVSAVGVVCRTDHSRNGDEPKYLVTASSTATRRWPLPADVHQSSPHMTQGLARKTLAIVKLQKACAVLGRKGRAAARAVSRCGAVGPPSI